MRVYQPAIAGVIALLAVAALSRAAGVFVATTWVAGVGNWDTVANWNTGNEPTAADEVFINNGGTVQVTTAGNAGANFNIGNSGTTGTLQVLGGTLQTVGIDIGNGAGSTGTLLVSGGGTIQQTFGAALLVGRNGGTGVVTVTGAGSLLNWTGGTPFVGQGAGGIATLNLVDQGAFSSAPFPLELAGGGATATVNVGTGGVAGVLLANVRTGGAPGAATLNFNHTGSVTYANVISGGVTTNKLGAGALTFTGANTHASTIVQAGTLFVNGTQPLSGVSLQGGVLGGTGRLGGMVATGGTVSPGLGPGVLTVGLATFNAASTFFVELNGAVAGTGYDQLASISGVTLGGATLSGTASIVHPVGTVFTIIDNQGAGAVTGTFAGLAEGTVTTISGQSFVISYVGGTGNDVTLTAVAAVPSMPLAGFVLLAALLGAVGYFRLRAGA